MKSFINFEGQVALVTGAGSSAGIGFAAAKILGELGAKVAITSTTDRIYDRVRELETLGITAKGYTADRMKKEILDLLKRRMELDLDTKSGLGNPVRNSEEFPIVQLWQYKNQ